jgi:hypothetical protein
MSVFTKGVIATIAVLGALFGMVYLLLTMILGRKLAYWLEGSVVFGVLSIMGFIWFISALGPTGPDTAWQVIAMGPGITQAHFKGTTYNIADYPGDGWQKPTQGKHLADLSGADDLLSEAAQAKPVLDTGISDAISPIPGTQAIVKDIVSGSIDLQTGAFTNVNMRMKPATVDGKDSIIAVATAVPSMAINGTLPNGATDGTLKNYLVSIGDKIQQGQDIMTVTTASGDVNVTAAQAGGVAEEALRPGDRVRNGGPVMTIDLTGQAGVPPDVTVAAVRVRGKLHTPGLYYMVVALILFVIHMVGLRAVERQRKASLETV